MPSGISLITFTFKQIQQKSRRRINSSCNEHVSNFQLFNQQCRNTQSLNHLHIIDTSITEEEKCEEANERDTHLWHHSKWQYSIRIMSTHFKRRGYVASILILIDLYIFSEFETFSYFVGKIICSYFVCKIKIRVTSVISEDMLSAPFSLFGWQLFFMSGNFHFAPVWSHVQRPPYIGISVLGKIYNLARFGPVLESSDNDIM